MPHQTCENVEILGDDRRALKHCAHATHDDEFALGVSQGDYHFFDEVLHVSGLFLHEESPRFMVPQTLGRRHRQACRDLRPIKLALVTHVKIPRIRPLRLIHNGVWSWRVSHWTP
jgi:hypothetical protein